MKGRSQTQTVHLYTRVPSSGILNGNTPNAHRLLNKLDRADTRRGVLLSLQGDRDSGTGYDMKEP